MIYYIDQSGKMESSGPTVLAIANDEVQTLLIDAAQKHIAARKVGRRFYTQTASMIGVRLFACAVAILVSLVDESDAIVIDTEYTGHDNRIRQIIRNRLPQIALPDDRLQFQSIGKASAAHIAALAVYRGNQKPTRKLKAADLI
jgi:hypothetical protein